MSFLNPFIPVDLQPEISKPEKQPSRQDRTPSSISSKGGDRSRQGSSKASVKHANSVTFVQDHFEGLELEGKQRFKKKLFVNKIITAFINSSKGRHVFRELADDEPVQSELSAIAAH
jgi:hypothetical protein